MRDRSDGSIDALWDFNDPVESERRFRAASSEATGDWWAELQTQIARAQGLQGAFAAGHFTLDQISDDGQDRVAVRRLLERGRLFNSAGEKSEAIPIFTAAADLAKKIGEAALEIDAIHMLAIVDDPGRAESWNERGLALARSSADPAAKRWVGSLLNNLGWAQFERGDPVAALRTFEEALAFREEQGVSGPIAVARWSVARMQRAVGQTEPALVTQLELAKTSPDPDGYVFEEIGECLTELGRPDEAILWFAKAYAILNRDHWLAEREPDRLARLARLGSSTDEE